MHMCVYVGVCVGVCMLSYISYVDRRRFFTLPACLPGGKQFEKAKHFQCIGKT